MADPITLGLLGASVGQSLLSSFGAKRKEKRRRRQRSRFFDNELAPLLEEATAEPDIDYSALREAELALPTVQFQDQLRNLSRTTDANIGQSGFANNEFITDDFNNQLATTEAGYEAQTFNIDRSLIDMQSQIDGMLNENKLRAKELEYSYKYG